ncbi:MAG: ORF6N domain-containing protein [Verrucomicrobia bacterium]|nr:ORF6N domain-containing protein [Verrucomicrobiota bacterium]
MGKTQSKPLVPRIHTVRRKKVVLDVDLARLYGVATMRLNEAVKRNSSRFPAEFSFLLTKEEFSNLISQIAISSDAPPETPRARSVTLKQGHGGTRKPPRVFTEHGALMAATVLRSEKAIQMSLYLVRAFLKMRETLLANTTILQHLAEIDRRLLEHDSVLRELVERLKPLLDAPESEEGSKPKIGFHQGNR